MKKYFPLLVLAFALTSSCKKTSSTSNNNVDTTVIKPSFLVNGIEDVTLTSYTNFYTIMNISVQYQDSAQQSVALSYSGFPAGVGVDSGASLSGIPTYTVGLSIIDTGAKPGTYPITITATSTSGSTKKYSFNLNILPMPTVFLGKYTNCISPCTNTGSPYTDSMYADATVGNKIWFANFGNTGANIYGLITFDSFLDPVFTIPAQTINGSTVTGTGNTIDFSGHSLLISIHYGSSACTVRMQ